MISVEPDKRIIDWSKLNRRLPLVGSHLFVLAFGGWLVSIRAQEASLPYKERAAHEVEQVKAQTGQTPLAAIKCEQHKSDVAVEMLDQAVAISNMNKLPDKLLTEVPECPRKEGTVPR